MVCLCKRFWKKGTVIYNKLKIVYNFIIKWQSTKKFILFFIFIFIFIFSTQMYITQLYSLYSFKTSKNVGLKTVEKDNILDYKKYFNIK
jgi:hypothetical protein